MRFRHVLLCAVTVFIPHPSIAQVESEIEVGAGCEYTQASSAGSVYTFASEQEAVDAIKRILSVLGARPNFEVKAAAIQNAQATMKDGQRFVLYSQIFMEDVRRNTGNLWAPTSILAHEIGHHINGDTFGINGQTRDQAFRSELEADRFSGAALQKLGATLDDSLAAMRMIGTAAASDSHPNKNTRLAAIANGWKQSAEIMGQRSAPSPRQQRNGIPPSDQSTDSTPQRGSPSGNDPRNGGADLLEALRQLGRRSGSQQGNSTGSDGSSSTTSTPSGMVCGSAAMSMSCPSIAVPGTNCRRCQ